jgi:hypothetical protein
MLNLPSYLFFLFFFSYRTSLTICYLLHYAPLHILRSVLWSTARLYGTSWSLDNTAAVSMASWTLMNGFYFSRGTYIEANIHTKVQTVQRPSVYSLDIITPSREHKRAALLKSKRTLNSLFIYIKVGYYPWNEGSEATLTPKKCCFLYG